MGGLYDATTLRAPQIMMIRTLLKLLRPPLWRIQMPYSSHISGVLVSRFSLVVEHLACNQKVAGSIPAGGYGYMHTYT